MRIGNMAQNSAFDGEQYLDAVATEKDRQETAIDDVAFLIRSKPRVIALDALAERPLDRSDLLDITGVSKTTIWRMMREFQKRHWVRKEGHSYEATQLGVFVSTKVDELVEQIETERKLCEAWEQLPLEASGLHVEWVSDAVVTIAEAASPYRPVNRFVSLLQEAEHFRFVGFDLAILEPCKDVLRDRILDGMRAEIIDSPSVARYIVTTYPDHCNAVLESGNFTVRLHDDLPTHGISLFDDRVGVVCYEPDSGTVRALIDTARPEVREWAESRYEFYRREARPLDTLTDQ